MWEASVNMGVGRPEGRLSRLMSWLRGSFVWRVLRWAGRGERYEWLSLILVWLAMSVAIWSVEQAAWIDPQPSLLATLTVAALTGKLLAGSGWRKAIVFPVMAVLGLVVVIWQAVGLFAAPGVESALAAWWDAVSGGRLAEGTIAFAMFLVLITWVIGLAASWFVLRRRNPWPAVATGSLAVIVNLSNLPREDYVFLPVFLVAALLLIGQVNLAKQGAWFGRNSARYSYRGMAYLAGAVVSISLVTVLAAWLVPEPPVERIQLASLGGGGNAWYNIFADVHSKWTVIDSASQKEMSFSDPLSTSSRIQFIVTAERPAYWRIRRYDVYQAWGWTSEGAVDHELSDLLPAPADADSETFTYTVENRLKTDVLLTVGEFVSASLPVGITAFDSQGTTEDTDSPPAAATGDEGVGDADARVADEEADPALAEETAAEPGSVASGDVITIVAPRQMKPYQSYTATAVVSLPTEEELSAAGDDYPQEILDRYLQLPEDLPDRVRELAAVLEIGEKSAYDKVLAIKDYVLRLNYNLESKPIPEGADAVDYFLFDSQEGVCTEFASALAILLRSIGIPSRFTTGYLEGDRDGNSGRYLLRVSDYHARTEVYFPGYGWVEFSATPVGGSVGAVIGGTIDDIAGGFSPELLIPGEAPFGEDFGVFTSSGSSGTGRSLPGPQLYVYFVIIGIPLALFLAVRLGYSLWLRGVKQVSNPAEVYQRMCRLASWGKTGPMEQETPLEYCARLAIALPLQAGSIDTIADAYIETQFSRRRDLTRLQKGRLQKAWVRLVPDLVRGLPRLWRESA